MTDVICRRRSVLGVTPAREFLANIAPVQPRIRIVFERCDAAGVNASSMSVAVTIAVTATVQTRAEVKGTVVDAAQRNVVIDGVKRRAWTIGKDRNDTGKARGWKKAW